MPRPYFVQECPVCGRPLEILVEYLGRRLTCDHCGGGFLAVDPAGHGMQSARGVRLLDRAEALLEASRQLPMASVRR
jgi:hypothetical protein